MHGGEDKRPVSCAWRWWTLLPMIFNALTFVLMAPLTLTLDLGSWLLPKRNLELGYMHSQCQHWDFEWMMKLFK